MDFHCNKCKKLTEHKSVNKPADCRELFVNVDGERGFFEQEIVFGGKTLTINYYQRYRECQVCHHVDPTIEMSSGAMYYIEQMIKRGEKARELMMEWRTQVATLSEKTIALAVDIEVG